MMDRDYEMLLISELEMKVLMASLGCDSLSGPFSPEKQESRESVLSAIAALLNRKQLVLTDGTLDIEPRLLNMLQEIAGAARCLVVRSETGRICCCYSGGRVTLVTPFEQAERMLRMIRLAPEEVADYLEEEGFFSDPPEMLASEEQQLWEQQMTVPFTAELYSGTELEETMRVLCAPISGCVIRREQNDGYGEEVPFEKELWRNQLMEMLTGGERV